MLKTLIPWLNKAMPLMMILFLIFVVIQLCIMLHISLRNIVQNINILIDFCRPLYLPLAVSGILLSLIGLFHEISSENLAQRGLRKRKGIFINVLTSLTHRKKLEENLSRQQLDNTLDAGELAASLRAHIIGQDSVCDDVALQLRRKLALKTHTKPIGIFLFAGSASTGKVQLAKQIAHQIKRPFTYFNIAQLSSPNAENQLFGSPKNDPNSNTFGRLTLSLKKQPDSVIILDDIESANPDIFKKFITAWNNGYMIENSTNEAISTKRSIFILIANISTKPLNDIIDHYTNEPDHMRSKFIEELYRTNFSHDVLNHLDRLFIFQKLDTIDLAHIAALEIENTINDYDLHVEPGGIDPNILFQLMKQQQLNFIKTPRDLVCFVEDMISDDLIHARQKNKKYVRLILHDNSISVETSDTPQFRLNPINPSHR